ncbi:MAG: tetratricopeptide repeat protein [Gammaproteobacteria bacterium]|nr:tetratricopeptide repeat protein [Gammaproteobacteria bacterium]
MTRSLRIPLVMLAALLVQGCAGQLPGPVFDVPSDPYQTLIVDSPWSIAPDEDVLALPEAARPFIEAATRGRGAAIGKVKGLAQLFGGSGALGLEYQVLAIGTAAETFETRIGSCLSYTHLYIAMARSIGVDAHYREIVAVPQWEVVGDFAVLNRHVAAYGEVPMFGSYVMDFGLLDESERQFGRVISDERARAQHFNNRGAWALSQGDAQGALSYFKRAILLDRSLSFVWANLGTAFMRIDELERAEQALRQALAIKPYETTAMNQSHGCTSGSDRDHLSQQFLERVTSALHQNPYLLFQRAGAARRSGEWRESVNLLRQALRIQPDELYFLIELGRSYREGGDIRRARRAFLDANALVSTLEERAALLDALGEPATPPTELVVPDIEEPVDA